uniref:Uncharacterized protein n=1 Tax=Anguilla anguilla TaxID=7936 RepID=A0A0E9Q4Q2_ANGAN
MEMYLLKTHHTILNICK